ncbi:MAG: hypothetical protein BWY73_00130 [candidate division TA06 bacterium ADurb.Bin417]|uniref:Glycosyl hydrolases family 2, sugar binding domain n=1 Tax=candidate division TA06 bacterium ADurb.Bin417 TaxID=1852828 RepID=A0A1V5MLT5_UNCT6|nr:MAG: hypothetical protein BWY73_00130 [candidate division TA06 bacterium ADurb.Bin417]
MAEDTLVSQTQWSGDVMAHYEFMDWPGIDKLGRHIDQNVTVKQVSSAAEQLGKARAFCEVYGCMGGQASFFHRKWIGDWQAVLGIGFVNHHLSLYSMRGERKRDYPANLFYQQPWWNDEKEFADYQGRLCRAVTEGKRLVDVLVIQPLTSVWCEYSPVDRGNGWASASVYDRPFADLTLRLLQEKIDFHYGNESLLAEHGRVEGEKLRLKEHAYSTVVVPPALNLNGATLDLLTRFAAAGGFVLFMGRRPELVDGRPGPVEIPSAQLAGSLDETVELVAARCPDRVSVLDRRTGRSAPAVYVQTRRVGDGLRHLLVNVDEKRAILVSARLPGLAAGAAVLDLSDGRSYRVPSGSDSLEFELAPAGSLLVLAGPEADSAEPVWPDLLGSGVLFRDITAGKPAVFLGKFECRLQEENVLLLNDFSLELDGRTVYQGPVSGAWHTHFYPAPEGTPFRAVYEFESAVELEGCFAAIEMAENLDRIEFNGVPVKPRKSRGDNGPFSPGRSWKDINFTRVDLPALRKGLNQLVIAGLKVNNISRSGCHHRVEAWQKHFPTEAEEIYLCGHFSLEKLAEGRYRVFRYRTPAGRNLAVEGYPFYSGRLTYRADFCWRGRYGGGAWLKLNGVSWLASIRVRVNGRDCATRRWAPWLVDISAALQPGENHLELDTAVTLVNAFGPNRQAGIKQDTGIGPRTFVLGDRFTRDYQLFEFGLENAVIYRR